MLNYCVVAAYIIKIHETLGWTWVYYLIIASVILCFQTAYKINDDD